MKFDKIAAEGIKKKFNLAEMEVRELKFANDQLNNKRTEHVAKISLLEEDLNNNRSEKLKIMHENSNSRETSAEQDAVFARGDLLEKLEMVDDLLHANENYKRTIEAQSADMLVSSHKLFDLNNRLTETRKHVVHLEAMTAEYNHTIDILQHEISRLRKELMDVSTGVSGQSSAVLSRTGAANRSNSISTAIVKSSYSFDGDEGAYSLSRRPRLEQGVSRERNKMDSNVNSNRSLRLTNTSGISSSRVWVLDLYPLSLKLQRHTAATSELTIVITKRVLVPRGGRRGSIDMSI